MHKPNMIEKEDYLVQRQKIITLETFQQKADFSVEGRGKGCISRMERLQRLHSHKSFSFSDFQYKKKKAKIESYTLLRSNVVFGKHSSDTSGQPHVAWLLLRCSYYQNLLTKVYYFVTDQ